MNKLIEKALKFATKQHGDINQRRKYTNEPYIVHPIAVAKTVKEYGGTPEMIAAGLLHDVVEDTPTTLGDVYNQFGLTVGVYLSYLTDVAVSSDGNRATRMNINNCHLVFAPPPVHTIKLADIYDNVQSIAKHDPKFAEVYVEEKKIQILFLKKGNTELYNKVFQYLRSL